MLCARAVLAYFIAAVSPNMDVANAALPAYVTSLLFFVGLLLRIQDQPNYWKWVSGLPSLSHLCHGPRLQRTPPCLRVTDSRTACYCAVQYGYIDFLKYAWSAQMINQFEGSYTRVLEGMTVRMSACAWRPHAFHLWIMLMNIRLQCIDQVLEFYGLNGKNKWAQLGYESLFFAGFTILAWAVRLLDVAQQLVHCFASLC